MAEDEAELQEFSLNFVDDRGPDDMVLPCGMTVLTLNLEEKRHKLVPVTLLP